MSNSSINPYYTGLELLAEKGYFPITCIHRDDIKQALIDMYDEKYLDAAVDEITDNEMSEIASALGNAVLDYMYWDTLRSKTDQFIGEKVSRMKTKEKYGSKGYPDKCPHKYEYENVWRPPPGGRGCRPCPDFDICKKEGGWCEYWMEIGYE